MHRDQLNSVVLITDAAGNTAGEENFLPFGLSAAENIPLPAVAEDAKGFIGERFAPEGGNRQHGIERDEYGFAYRVLYKYGHDPAR